MKRVDWPPMSRAQEASIHALAGDGTWMIDYRGRDGAVIVFFYEPYEHFLVEQCGRTFTWDHDAELIGNPGADLEPAEK